MRPRPLSSSWTHSARPPWQAIYRFEPPQAHIQPYVTMKSFSTRRANAEGGVHGAESELGKRPWILPPATPPPMVKWTPPQPWSVPAVGRERAAKLARDTSLRAALPVSASELIRTLPVVKRELRGVYARTA